MTERIGKSLLAREALLAAFEAKKRAAAAGPPDGSAFARALDGPEQPRQGPPVDSVSKSKESLASSLEDGLRQVDASVRRAGALDEAMATGKIRDFHEVAVHLKQADLSFRFALEVRNRLIDAYREIMRLSV